jgi:hypothetical protein
MKTLAFALAALLPLAAIAQPEPAPAPMPRTMSAPTSHGYIGRLEKMLRDSRDQRRRVVVLVNYQEIAGVVLDLGPDWVVLSNQKDQEILLQTRSIERAEFR